MEKKKKKNSIGVSKRERNDEVDPSFRLVGRIVEKGFSTEKKKLSLSPSSLPQPSVLPFPIARHRSHGPHWVPINTSMDVDNNEDDDMDFSPNIANFAKPIQRKQKKGMDFKNWRELVNQTNSITKENGERRQRRRDEIDNDHNELINSDKEVSRESNLSAIVHQSNGRDNKTDGLVVKSLVQENIKHEGSRFDDFSSRNCDDGGGDLSLESQIDAENRAQLEQMSLNEIVEAQGEIMEKMKPGLIEMLKKRGRNKLGGKPKNPTSDSQLGTQCNENQLNQDSKKDSLLEEPRTQHVSALRPSNYAQDVLSTGGVGASGTTNNKWNSWSERVEAARTLRFSLDGNVVENHSFEIPGHGNISDRSQSSVDKVTERDFLRTEGDPGGVGYTIKEAVTLCRSMVPGQRSIALQLLASILDKALCEIRHGEVRWDVRNASNIEKFVDWMAVWAFALGPEPELSLSLRMALDDNHISVVFTTLKVIHSVLSCDMNENFFDISEKMATHQKAMCTAPIFRSRPEIDVGFLHGGFWKYNTKPSNILPLGDGTVAAENEGNYTIQDDIVVAGQDFAAGLIRMGVVPRIRYLLETDPTAALEEHLISILIGLARHSPTSANAIMKCPRLLQTIVDRFVMKDSLLINPSKIKSTTLLKVLALSDKKNCIDLIEKGVFRHMMWHFYRHPISFESWIKSGRENCILMSALMVEQLRLWKVCIEYAYCISYFADFFPILCLWLSPPTFDDLIENNVFGEFASITTEAYLVLEALARRLPNLHSKEQLKEQTPDFPMEMWSWSHVSPVVESALKWVSLKNNSYLSKIIDWPERTNTEFVSQDSSMSCMVWVISAVMHMLSSILKKVAPESGNSMHESGGRVPWLPEFVPKIGLEILKSRFLDFPGDDMFPSGGVSLAKGLCHLGHQGDNELSLSAVCCLHGLVWLIVSVDNSIQTAKQENYTPSSGEHSFSREGKILEDGIYTWSQGELRNVLVTFMTSVSSRWHDVQCIEVFGRGGPAPGIGLGWGASGGGFWSMTVLIEQTEARLLMELVEMFQIVLEKDALTLEDETIALQRINCVLGVCLAVGPRDAIIMEKALDLLLQVPVLKYLDFCVHRFLHSKGSKALGWEHKEDDYLNFSKILKRHFKTRWLCVKRKSKSVDSNPDSGHKTSKKGSNALDTIYEDLDTLDVTVCNPHCTSMVIEWAHQRLPLPMHWFLSPISTIGDISPSDEVLEIAKSGLFFLLGLEAISSLPCTTVQSSPVHSVPLIWKLHSLSVVLLVGMSVLQEKKSRDIYEALQQLYGQLLDESRCSRCIKDLADMNENLLPETGKEYVVESLKFQRDVHESYTTFIETLVEQFGAASYGDVIYARQVAMYLHCSVEAPVRLAVWNALSNAHILELLPPLGECFAKAEGFLDIEDNEGILEAYVKSWVSGGLDKAAARGSMTFTLALHHLSSFIFCSDADDKLSLRNKLAKSLLRDYSRKQKHEAMMLDLIQYNNPEISQERGRRETSLVHTSEKERRLRLLAEACEGNSTLLTEVERLKSCPILFQSSDIGYGGQQIES